MQVTFDAKLAKIAELKSNAKKGDRMAQYKLARLYAKTGNAKLCKEAFELYKLSAKQRLPEAAYRLGLCYEFAIGTTKKYSAAIRWYGEACSYASAEVWQNSLHDSRYYSKLLAPYFEDEEYRKAADEYFEEKERQEKEKTFAEWLAEAEAGDLSAQNLVGHTYYYGSVEVERNFEQAIRWWEKAAAGGNEASVSWLVSAYGEAGQPQKAVVWWRKKAELEIKQRNKEVYGYEVTDR